MIRLNEKRLLETFIELCRIPSPSGREDRIASYIRERASSLGVPVTEDDAGEVLGGNANNMVIHLEGDSSREPLFIVSHMDTVPVPDVEELSVVEENGVIKTDGSHPLGADDKAGVAIELELLSVLVEERNSGLNSRGVDFVFSVQEEVGTRGAFVLDSKLINARIGFVLDSEFNVGSAINRSSYKRRFRIGVYGKSSHAAVAPERGINAVKALGSIITRLPTGKWGHESVINLGIISGGSSTNVVPGYAELIGETRSFSEEELKKLVSTVERGADTTGADSLLGQVKTEVIWESLYDGYMIDEGAASSVIFKRACKINGYKPRFVKSLGGSDANHLNKKGLECIVLGLGMKNIHSNDEYITRQDLINAYKLLYTIVK